MAVVFVSERSEICGRAHSRFALFGLSHIPPFWVPLACFAPLQFSRTVAFADYVRALCACVSFCVAARETPILLEDALTPLQLSRTVAFADCVRARCACASFCVAARETNILLEDRE
jgi:hypothetical protein